MDNEIELYGERTGNCFRASIALEETGLPYRVNKIDFRSRQHRSPEFLSLNPVGRVPTIIDPAAPGGPLVLTQSLAILSYADQRVPGILFPNGDIRSRTVAMERFFYFVTDVLGPGLATFKISNDDGQRELVQTALIEWAGAERFLTSSRYLAGDQFTAADIVAYTYILPHQRYLAWDQIPLLQRWFADVARRPTVQRGVAAFDVAAA
jgi:GST-like protein